MKNPRRLASLVAVLGLALAGVMALPHEAKAWWRGGYGYGFVAPPFYGPRVYAAPPIVYAPPLGAYYPQRRFWAPPHWEGRYWVRGYWH